MKGPANAACPSVGIPTLFIGRVWVGLVTEITSGRARRPGWL